MAPKDALEPVYNSSPRIDPEYLPYMNFILYQERRLRDLSNLSSVLNKIYFPKRVHSTIL